MFDFIAEPMGQVLKFLYDTIAFQNFGVSIILFTLFIKTLMLPPEALTSINRLLPGNGLPNMLFLGLNLGAIPSHVFSSGSFSIVGINSYVLLLIPLIAFASAWAATKTSKQNIAGTDGSAAMMNGTSQIMTMVSPIMSGIITMTMPAGMGLYWIIGNVYQIAQDLFLRKICIRSEQQ